MNSEPEYIKMREKNSQLGERSNSYSEAINNSWLTGFRSSIEEANIINSKAYMNSESASRFRQNSSSSNVRRGSRASKSADNLEKPEEVFSDCQNYLLSEEDFTTNDSVGHTGHMDRNFDEIMVDMSESPYDNNTSTTPYPETSTEYASIFPMQYDSQKRRHRRRLNKGARRIRAKRVVFKNGHENVPLRHNIPRKYIKYLRDIVNTVINSKWRFLICFCVMAHFAFWLFFGLIWFSVTNSYQDDYQDGKEHCVTGTSSFAGFLLLAIETQMTIGYGSRYPSEECPEAILIMVVEIVAGTALSGGLSGLLYSKLVRPQKHLKSVGFSQRAVVCLRDGNLCLMFRVWDLKQQHSINSTVTAYLLKPIRTLEGEHHFNYIHKLELKDSKSFLIWPLTIVHVIDQDSPLFDVSAKDLLDLRFEIVVCLTGSSLSLGTFSQSRTSYLSKEIIWGYRFVNVVQYSKDQESYIIDEENLNSVEQVDTPLCSASRLLQVERDCNGSSHDLIEENIHSLISSPNDSTLPGSPLTFRRNAVIK